ncbi:MAG TPA: MFS transporter, partial [Actinotalea sp.]|nr:MFS transporter [Actinotalea sp.]
MSLAIPIGRLADRWGRARVLVVGHVALVTAYLSAAVALGSAWTTLATLLLLGVFYAATDGVLSALVGEHADTSVRAAAIGTAQTVVAVARMAASTGFGVMWYTMGRESAMLTVTVLLAVAVPAAYALVRGLDGAAPQDGDEGGEPDGEPPAGTGTPAAAHDHDTAGSASPGEPGRPVSAR